MNVEEHSIPVVDIVEDDEPVAASLVTLLDSAGMTSQHFPTREEYLSYLAKASRDPHEMRPGCVLLDIRLGASSGLLVFDEMAASFADYSKPVIFLTGHGDMDTAIDVLTRGAHDFVSKPFSSTALILKVKRAIDLSAESLAKLRFRTDVMQKLQSLTAKEVMVLRGIISGRASRIIAEESGNSVRTIELHRSRILEKMQVENAIELSGLLARAGWMPVPETDS